MPTLDFQRQSWDKSNLCRAATTKADAVSSASVIVFWLSLYFIIHSFHFRRKEKNHFSCPNYGEGEGGVGILDKIQKNSNFFSRNRPLVRYKNWHCSTLIFFTEVFSTQGLLVKLLVYDLLYFFIKRDICRIFRWLICFLTVIYDHWPLTFACRPHTLACCCSNHRNHNTLNQKS